MDWLFHSAKFLFLTFSLMGFGAQFWPALHTSSMFSASPLQEHSCIKRGDTRYRC